jgi:hypothetical protein
LTQTDKKRPPYRICQICGRKRAAPEKSLGKWRMPPKKKTCYNCTSIQFDDFNDIIANRKILIKSKKEAEAVFPLRLLDMTNNKLIGNYNDSKSLRKSLNLYRAENPKSETKVIDGKYHDFTEHFRAS